MSYMRTDLSMFTMYLPSWLSCVREHYFDQNAILTHHLHHFSNIGVVLLESMQLLL